MTTKMTENGITTTQTPGQEQHEFWTDFQGRKWCCYDYRHTSGELFSCNDKTLEKCRQRRDNWLKKQEG